MHRSAYRKIIPYLLTLIATLLFFIHIYNNAAQYRNLLQLSLRALLLLAAIAVLSTGVNGFINLLFYRGLGVALSLHEGIGLAAINTLANQLPFAGGVIAKGVYLKRKYQLTYTRYFSATVALYVCFVVLNGIIGLVILSKWMVLDQITIPLLLPLGFAGMAGCILTFWIPTDIVHLTPQKLRQRFARLLDGWTVLRQDFVLLGKLVGVQSVMTLLLGGRLWISFHALSQGITITQCVLLSAATILTRLVSITPGGLGIREGIIAGVAVILGFEWGVSIVAVGLDRLISTAVIIVLGTIYTFILSKKATRTNPDAAEIS